MTKQEKQEIRNLTAPIELRAVDDEGKEPEKHVIGYALRFNSESQDLGGFVETISPTALDNADLSDVRALFNHNPSKVLGRSKSGTLTLTVDDFGLKYDILMPDTSEARDLMLSMDRKDIDSSSFGFILDYDKGGDIWEYEENTDVYKRTITDIKKITDISIVTYPAYLSTESLVATRSLEDYKNELEKAKEKERLYLELDLY